MLGRRHDVGCLPFSDQAKPFLPRPAAANAPFTAHYNLHIFMHILVPMLSSCYVLFVLTVTARLMRCDIDYYIGRLMHVV